MAFFSKKRLWRRKSRQSRLNFWNFKNCLELEVSFGEDGVQHGVEIVELVEHVEAGVALADHARDGGGAFAAGDIRADVGGIDGAAEEFEACAEFVERDELLHDAVAHDVPLFIDQLAAGGELVAFEILGEGDLEGVFIELRAFEEAGDLGFALRIRLAGAVFREAADVGGGDLEGLRHEGGDDQRAEGDLEAVGRIDAVLLEVVHLPCVAAEMLRSGGGA